MSFDRPDEERYERFNVLVLEDEIHIRQIVCRLLRQIGFRHITDVGDGIEGFKELLRLRPNLIICDVHMEPMDGLAFLEKLRKIPKKSSTRSRWCFSPAIRPGNGCLGTGIEG